MSEGGGPEKDVAAKKCPSTFFTLTDLSIGLGAVCSEYFDPITKEIFVFPVALGVMLPELRTGEVIAIFSDDDDLPTERTGAVMAIFSPLSSTNCVFFD